MWEFFKQYPFIIGAFSGSLAAYLLGLIVTYLRRDKRWIGYSIENRNVAMKGHTKLKMKFEDRDIERLDSHSVVLSNIGNMALTKQLVTIELDGEIVEATIKGPAGCKIAEDRKKSTLGLTPDLLNPKERVEIEITSADTSRGDLRVVARGEYLEVKSVSAVDLDPDLLVAALETLPFAGRMIAAMYRIVQAPSRSGSRILNR